MQKQSLWLKIPLVVLAPHSHPLVNEKNIPEADF
jgi:hypothetical protein